MPDARISRKIWAFLPRYSYACERAKLVDFDFPRAFRYRSLNSCSGCSGQITVWIRFGPSPAPLWPNARRFPKNGSSGRRRVLETPPTGRDLNWCALIRPHEAPREPLPAPSTPRAAPSAAIIHRNGPCVPAAGNRNHELSSTSEHCRLTSIIIMIDPSFAYPIIFLPFSSTDYPAPGRSVSKTASKFPRCRSTRGGRTFDIGSSIVERRYVLHHQTRSNSSGCPPDALALISALQGGMSSSLICASESIICHPHERRTGIRGARDQHGPDPALLTPSQPP